MNVDPALISSDLAYRQLVQGVVDYAIYMLSPNGVVVNWNAGAQRAKGYAAAEIIGRHFSCFYEEADRDAGIPARNLETAKDSGKFEETGWRVRKDGSRLWAHVVIDAIRDADGALLGFAKITRDCTGQRIEAEKLRQTAANLDLALTHMANGICLFDQNGKLVLYNQRLHELVGASASTDFSGLTLEEICRLNPLSANDRLAAYDRVRAAGGGEAVTVLSTGKVLRTIHRPADNGHWVMTTEDITERHKAEERVAHLARHDPLTGLPNRRRFIEVLDASIISAQGTGRVAVIGIDLDRFKDINDTYGHAAGDTVLSVLSGRLSNDLLPGEVVGRFGGDEFVALKSFRADDELQDFVSRLRRHLTGKIILSDTQVTPGASLGIAVYPTDADDREQLLKNADLAMYRAKASFNEMVYFYDPSMDEAERARRQLSHDIWTGLEKGEFFLNFQVQRDARSSLVAGYEVLLRWRHPTLGLVSPGMFIPIAEECGAIVPLGEWVLEQACIEAATWGSKDRIAVNLSPLQISNGQIVERVREILLSSGLAPSRLELEVTESALIADRPGAFRILQQIRALGVSIAIDDFGTGYSSLETLRSFPFDKIKLDRSFVADLDSDRQAKAFVRAILALGKSLEVPVLAEGVETARQMDILTDEGCDQFQGFYLGRPTVVHELPDIQRSTTPPLSLRRA